MDTCIYLSQLSELQSLLYAADMEKYSNTHTQIKIPTCELKKLYSLENKKTAQKLEQRQKLAMFPKAGIF
jgi:hypothetical protein